MRCLVIAQRPICFLLAVLVVAGPIGCRNPAHSDLPPTAMSPPGTPMPVLAKGDVYADETELPPDSTIRSGDELDVVVRRGSGEETMTAYVRKTGWANVAFVQVDVRGLTASQAAERMEASFKPYMRNPLVQVRIKRQKLKIKRVFVFGDVEEPGMYPMTRYMTVMEALLAAQSYKETAVLDEVRVIRGDLNRPTVLTADIARMLTYGDASRNVQLQENDVVYVPRARLGDASEFAKQVGPILGVALAPLQAAFFTQLLIAP